MADVLITAQPQAKWINGKESDFHLAGVEPEANAIKAYFGVRAEKHSRISVGKLQGLLTGKRIWFFPGHGDAMLQGEPVLAFENDGDGQLEVVSVSYTHLRAPRDS